MQNNKSILIVGNGPSSSYKEAGQLAKGCEVARVNWFFLEKEQIFGKQVDYLFHISCEPLIEYIYFVLNSNDLYHVKNHILFYHPRRVERLKFILKGCVTEMGFNEYKPRSYSPNNKVNQTSFKHIKPVGGLHILQYVLKLGYQTIHIAGMDFYQGEYVYLTKKNARIIELCPRFMKRNRLRLQRAYDVKAHTLEYDISYLKDLLAQYPAVKIIATSCHPETTKIWQQFKQVEVMELSSHQSPEIYDAYLDKPWLQKAVDDFSKKYGFRIKLRHRIREIRSRCKKRRVKKRVCVILAVIFLTCLVYLINQF